MDFESKLKNIDNIFDDTSKKRNKIYRSGLTGMIVGGAIMLAGYNLSKDLIKYTGLGVVIGSISYYLVRSKIEDKKLYKKLNKEK